MSHFSKEELDEAYILGDDGAESAITFPLAVNYIIKGLLMDPEMHIHRVRKVVDTAGKSKVSRSKILVKMGEQLIERATTFYSEYVKAL